MPWNIYDYSYPQKMPLLRNSHPVTTSSPTLTPVIPSTNHFILLKGDFFWPSRLSAEAKPNKTCAAALKTSQGIVQGNSKLISQFAVYFKIIEKSYTTITNFAVFTTNLTFWKVTLKNTLLKRVKKKKLRNWNHSCVAAFCMTWCPQSPQLKCNFTAKTNEKSKTNSSRL